MYSGMKQCHMATQIYISYTSSKISTQMYMVLVEVENSMQHYGKRDSMSIQRHLSSFHCHMEQNSNRYRKVQMLVMLWIEGKQKQLDPQLQIIVARFNHCYCTTSVLSKCSLCKLFIQLYIQIS